jgi:predicted transcriptional regulator
MTALQGSPVVLTSEEVAELDREWAAIKAGEHTVSHEEVARWLQTWGTPAFKPWHKR